MKKLRTQMRAMLAFAAMAGIHLSFTTTVNACTRIVYQGPAGLIMTARSMDWRGEIPANLWIMPRGIERNGEVGGSSIKWKAKYGSVITSSWDLASSDGMNEKGLVGNMLWLAESKYPDFPKRREDKRTGSFTVAAIRAGQFRNG